MPRFVILYHQLPDSAAASEGRAGSHWDWMLQQQDTLATWALASPPSTDRINPSFRIADHRLAYLDYEGPVSGNRGQVTRWDRGVFDLELWESHRIRIDCRGDRIRGRWEFEATETPSQWHIRCLDPAQRLSRGRSD